MSAKASRVCDLSQEPFWTGLDRSQGVHSDLSSPATTIGGWTAGQMDGSGRNSSVAAITDELVRLWHPAWLVALLGRWYLTAQIDRDEELVARLVAGRTPDLDERRSAMESSRLAYDLGLAWQEAGSPDLQPLTAEEQRRGRTPPPGGRVTETEPETGMVD